LAFQRGFDELLNEVLTEYQTQFPGAVTQGSVLFLKAACTASMLWGLYRQLDRAADQFFVASADRANIERHAAEFGIPTAGRTDAQIVDDVLAAKRSKLAGGNRYDYVAWAKEVYYDHPYTLGDGSVQYERERVIDAYVEPLAQGEGSFDIIVRTNRTAVSDEIAAKVREVCLERRPIGSGIPERIRAVKAVGYHIGVHIKGQGAAWDVNATRAAIVEYVSGLGLGSVLYTYPNGFQTNMGLPVRRSMLAAIAHGYGAETVEVVLPGSDHQLQWRFPDYEYARPGNITVEVVA